MRAAGRFNAQLLDEVRPMVMAGVKTRDIDDLVQTSNYTASDCDPRLTYMNDTLLPQAWNGSSSKIPITLLESVF